MPAPHELLAESLNVLRSLALEKTAIKTSEISRTHRERLLKHGFLKEITKGWYVSSNPNELPGDTTSWYMSYWKFCSEYLRDKYGDEYCLSAEQSLLVHAGNTTIPTQLIVRSPDGSNKTIGLLNDTSLYLMKSALPTKSEIVVKNGVRILSLPFALINISPIMYQKSAMEVRIALAQIDDPSGLLRVLLDGAHTTIAGRLAGGFRNIGQDRIAERIINTMKSAGYDVREEDPFQNAAPFKLLTRVKSPQVTRIKLMWEEMRTGVIRHFPKAPGLPYDQEKYLKAVDEIYVTDAYHSLSIERYVVSAELIEKVRSGEWNTNDEVGKKHQDAMAARGYWQASQKVKDSISKILMGANAGSVADLDHGDWYTELFAPSATAGIIKSSDLAGYRNAPVFISNSMHIPPDHRDVGDTMTELFELLTNETHPGVRAVLGHFIFVFIHPYMDGNGRMGRFLMNLMLASGGYPWTVIPVQERKRYMQALERASVTGDIEPFAIFIAYLVTESLNGTPVAQLLNSPINP